MMCALIRPAIGTIMLMLALVPATLSAEQLHVFVSILPQKYFVQQIGKDKVSVEVMVQPGASPATYEPKPRQLAALVSAKIYLSIGVPFERVWLKKIAAANPGMTIVATDEGIQKISMDSHHHDHASHSHADKAHHPDTLDPHIWTSPVLVKHQAGIIFDALKKADPGNTAFYKRNYGVFVDALNRLDTDIKAIFSDKKGSSFLCFHPSWGYFARAYGLKQVTIEIEGKAPKPAQLKEIIAHAREQQIKAIFVQPQFSTKSAELIADAIDGKIILADPLAADWAVNLRSQAKLFNSALR